MPILNVFGEVAFTGEDIAPLVIKNKKGPFRVVPDIMTSSGFTLYDEYVKTERCYRSGFYAIYYKEKCLYVGKASIIDNRMRRFISGVRGTSRHDEQHAFADRYRKRYGEDFDNLRFVLFPYDIGTLNKHEVRSESVESGIMSILGSIDNKVRN